MKRFLSIDMLLMIIQLLTRNVISAFFTAFVAFVASWFFLSRKSHHKQKSELVPKSVSRNSDSFPSLPDIVASGPMGGNGDGPSMRVRGNVCGGANDYRRNSVMFPIPENRRGSSTFVPPSGGRRNSTLAPLPPLMAGRNRRNSNARRPSNADRGSHRNSISGNSSSNSGNNNNRRISTRGRGLLIRPMPSPRGYPILGHIPMIGKHPHLSFLELGRPFNGIFQLSLGGRKLVVLDRYKTVVEAFRNPGFAGRPHVPSFLIFKESGSSYLGVEDANEKWKFLKKAVRKSLAMVASSKNSRFEAVIAEAIDSINKDIDGHLEIEFKPEKSVAEVSAAIIGSLLFGKSFDRKDLLITELCRGTRIALDFLQVGALMDCIPFGTFLFRAKIQRFLTAVQPINQLAASHIRSHVTAGDSCVSDIADALSETAATTPPSLKQQLGVDDDTIKFLAQDLFFAGFSAVGECLHWLLNTMAACTEQQDKVQAEIERVLQGRQPTIADRYRMPFVEATILETCRFVSLQPLAAPHSTMHDVLFQGYQIPAGTTVICNLWAVHHDENLFPKANLFRPERFLNADGSFNTTAASKVIQFGTGKRKCPGEAMARQELFLLFSSLLQRYKITPGENEKIDINQCQQSLDRKAIDYALRFARRQPSIPIRSSP